MPYHNGMKEYIADSIKAVANQTGVDVTLYLCDNGSTDGTSELVNALIEQEMDRNPMFMARTLSCAEPGVAFARNAAMELLKSVNPIVDAVAFCDCDDVWDHDHLSRSMNVLIETGADMVYSDVRCVDEDGNPLIITGIPYFGTFERNNLLAQNFIFISSVVMKSECMSVGGFDHDADPMGDWDYWLRVSSEFKVHHHALTTITYLWKTKSGSYYQPEKMNTAFEYVKNKHNKNPNIMREFHDKYQHISGWLSSAEGATLQKYGADKVCLEVGSYKGKSSCYIAEVAQNVTCIDTFLADTSGQNQVAASTYEEFRHNTQQFQKKIRAIVGYSTEMAPLLQEEYFDMIFLDAMHDYDSVYNDLSAYWDKLKMDGYFLFHDYANPDYPGVGIAARELIGDPEEVIDSIGVYKKTSAVLNHFRARGFFETPPEKKVESVELEAQEKLTEQKIDSVKTDKKYVVLAPFARQLPDGKPNPKNFPVSQWESLVELLRKADIYTIQIGAAGEPFIGADEMQFNPSNETLTQLCDNMSSFISVDTFFQHFAAYHGKKGVVIFSQSDPKIFGHPSNVNLLKTKDSLRAEQFQLWTQTDYDENAFPSVSNVFEELMKLLQRS